MTTTTTIQATAEQLAVLALARDPSANIIINAKAGSGKTSTLRMLVPQLRGSTLLMAFNKAIQLELEAKIRPSLTGFASAMVAISTVHSHGLRAFKRAGRSPKTLAGKVSFILKDKLQQYAADDDVHRNARHIAKLVGIAKSSGFGLASTSSHDHFAGIDNTAAFASAIEHFNLAEEFEGRFTEQQCIELAQWTLRESNRRLDSIDFDDMIYLPLLHNFPLELYDNVLLDEAQDINATRRELAFRSLKPTGRLIAVGDPNQAIYGFTGADTKSLQNLRDRSGAVELPLSICWRCDAAIITEAQRLVPDIQARPGAPAGSVSTVVWEKVESAANACDFLSLPSAGDAILCRMNKPNVAVALGLLRRGVPARIEGRDIGKRILDHVKRATSMYDLQPLADSLPDLDNYLEAETAKLMLKGRELAIGLLEDEVGAAQLLIERCIETSGAAASWRDLEALADSLFGENISSKQLVTLSSVHKSKGREWPRVFILGYKDYMPFHRATLPWQREQEYNLIYVAQTRAEQSLIYVNGVASAIDRGLHREAPKPAAVAAPSNTFGL